MTGTGTGTCAFVTSERLQSRSLIPLKPNRSSIHNPDTDLNMPVSAFFPQQHKFDIMAIVRSQTTDSTIDTREVFSTESDLTPPPRMVSHTPPSTPPARQIWRKKATPSVFRSSPCKVEGSREDVWMLRSCDAFDDDDDDC
jgi:hypothetical protein